MLEPPCLAVGRSELGRRDCRRQVRRALRRPMTSTDERRSSTNCDQLRAGCVADRTHGRSELAKNNLLVRARLELRAILQMPRGEPSCDALRQAAGHHRLLLTAINSQIVQL